MKILVIRFSSIGDIVLTTPVVRCLKEQLSGVEIHYVTKQQFVSVLQANTYIDKIHTIQKSIFEITTQLKKENFDAIIDLHHNIRTLKLKLILGKKSYSFEKLNWEKFLMVQFKINNLPKAHIVERYLDTVKPLGIINDHKGLDYFIPEKDIIKLEENLPTVFLNGYYTLVVGGSYFTKQIPLNKLKEICTKSSKPLVLLGGKDDSDTAEALHHLFKETTINLCGKINLNQSASVIQQAEKVITSDTGLMHIAAAFNKDIISLWGNTIPEFGMGPYLPSAQSKILEVENLNCRPCSKLGYHQCPKKHFKCMNDIEINFK